MNDMPDLAGSYDREYYAAHCGSVPYERNDYWLGIFGGIADQIVRAFAPRRVFDAGCALGMLVESLWDRGVETHARDISEFAISHVRPDVRSFCNVGSISEPIEGHYDLAVCIEVVEHMPPREAELAIRALAACTSRVLFSSSPIDFDEPTHINVRPAAYWLGLWAEAGFAPSVTHDAGYLAPHAFLVERSEVGRSPLELAAFVDRIRHRLALAAMGERVAALQALIRRMDLDLSLMYTPHTSYPPLDLAASGAVVVTNRFGPKTSLERYSPNIICADTDVPALVAGLAAGAVLAADLPRRAANLAQARLGRDWSVTAHAAIERVAAWADAATA